MNDRAPQLQPMPQRSNRLPAVITVGVASLMLGMSFAAVPLYRMFCAMTGYGGTTQRVVAAPAAPGERTLTVRFDSNVAGALPWSFEPETRQITLRTGETKTVFYRVTNLHASGEGARTSWKEGQGSTPLQVGSAVVQLDF